MKARTFIRNPVVSYSLKVINFFTIACQAEISSGLDGIERAILSLASSRDTTVHKTMVESLLEITSGYSLSKTTHLKKAKFDNLLFIEYQNISYDDII